MGLDIEMKDTGTTSAAEQPAASPPVPHLTPMGKAKLVPTLIAEGSSVEAGDAEDEFSQGQGMLLELYENLQAELKEVRLHLLKLETESSIREMKLFQEVLALEKLVEEQGLQIYQLEQRNNALAGLIVDVTHGPKVSSAELDSNLTCGPESSTLELESGVIGAPLVGGNKAFAGNIPVEVWHLKSQVYSADGVSLQDLVDGSPERSDVFSSSQDVPEGLFGYLGSDCITKIEAVNIIDKDSGPEGKAVIKMLETDSRNVGSACEFSEEGQDSVSEDVDVSCIFLTKVPEVRSSVLADGHPLPELLKADSKVTGNESNTGDGNVGMVGRVVGESSGASADMTRPKAETIVRVVWAVNSTFSPDSGVIKFVDEVLSENEGFCSLNSQEFEDLHDDKENLANIGEIHVTVDEYTVVYNPDEAERVEKDLERSGSVTETAEPTKKLVLDFHSMTVKGLENKRGVHKTNAILLCSKKLDPRDLKTLIALIEKGVATKEMRLMVRVMRHTMAIRRQLNASTLISFLRQSLPTGSEPLSRLVPYLSKEEERDMDVDAPSPPGQTQVSAKQTLLPEVEIYAYLLTLIFLIDQKQYEAAKTLSVLAVKRVQNFNRRTLDVLAARLYFYFSYSFELAGCLSQIRSSLLALHRTATLRHDELGQETLLNLLLRNYLYYNLYDQAEKLRSKTQRVEAHSNQQLCRYLYYLGRIRTIQLEYTDAKECLLQAARKAPSTARGFRIQCNKWAVIVRLLLGEIPERTTFMQQGMQKPLRPYFELTNAVRIGDLELFRSVAERNSTTFHADKTQNLIVRLRHNVIRTGLRNISISYSRISLADVAAKLHLQSATAVADAESIVTKAIRDGGIDATVDHANGWMQSKETGDIYSTQEPQTAFHSRIAFCLNTHNEAVKALRFPPDAHKKELESAEKRRERQQQEQELAKHIAEEDDDEF